MKIDYYYIAQLVDKSARIAIEHQFIDKKLLSKKLGISLMDAEYVLNLLYIFGVIDMQSQKVISDSIGKCGYLNLSSTAQAYYVAAGIWRMSHPDDLQKGLWVCNNSTKASILETGINPSGTENGFLARESDFANCNDRYWKRLKMIYGPDTLNKAAYLDLFPFHEADQFLAEKTSPELLKDFLLITMGQIERMNPTLIIIGNKRSAAFWGHHPKYAWMDYDFADRIPDNKLPLVAQGRNLEVYQIQGFLNRPDRIHNLTNTNLRGSIVINYGYHGRIPHTMTPEITREMLLFAKREKVKFTKRNSQ